MVSVFHSGWPLDPSLLTCMPKHISIHHSQPPSTLKLSPLSVCHSVGMHVCWGFPCESPFSSFPKHTLTHLHYSTQPFWRRRSLLGIPEEKLKGKRESKEGRGREREWCLRHSSFCLFEWQQRDYIQLCVSGLTRCQQPSLTCTWGV